MSGIADRLTAVRDRIRRAAEGAGRDPAGIRLVVVTKDVDAARIREAIDAGATELGENRAQELDRKIEELGGSAAHVRWHFIGTLQRNKAKLVAGRAAMIHSVDSFALGKEIAARAAVAGSRQDVLLEVNVAGEASKHGVAPGAAWDLAASLSELAGVHVRGLMTIAPAGLASGARAAFAGLRELRDELRAELGGGSLEELSMGMTSDFEIAIEEGATIVRVGTAIFGARP